jgi:hypothetical protein
MISRSERRRRCRWQPPPAIRPLGQPQDPGPSCWIGALDEPTRFYQARAICRVDAGIGEIERRSIAQAVQQLGPLTVLWQDDELHCRFGLAADSADQAAWSIVARLRESVPAHLVYVAADVPGEIGSEVVLTSVEDGHWPDPWPSDDPVG